MKRNIFIYLFFIFVFICSCSEEETTISDLFTKKTAQDVTERTFGNLNAVDSLNITNAYDGSSLSHMKLNKESIVAKVDDKFTKLNKQDLSIDSTFALPEGRGPGEIQRFALSQFDIGNNTLSVYSWGGKKTALYDLNGCFREEFLNGAYSISEMDMANEHTYYFQVELEPEHIFFEVKREGSESIINREFQKKAEELNLLAYSGRITYHDQSLYFGGYSEPMIRKYDLSGDKVELIFSRAVIDQYDTEDNYRKPQRVSGAEEGRFWRYAEEAQYASEDIDVDDTFLYSVRHHNDEAGYKYLDLYSAEDGKYEGSFNLLYYPSEIVVDEEYIYTLEDSGDSKYLMKYQKPEMDF